MKTQLPVRSRSPGGFARSHVAQAWSRTKNPSGAPNFQDSCGLLTMALLAFTETEKPPYIMPYSGFGS